MSGYSLIDVLVTMAVAGCVMSISVPRLDAALDAWRARGAAYFLAERVALTRMQAVHRGGNVALRFEAEDGTFRLRAYADGNDNGVRSADIGGGYDPPITPAGSSRSPVSRCALRLHPRRAADRWHGRGDGRRPDPVWRHAHDRERSGRDGHVGHGVHQGTGSGAVCGRGSRRHGARACDAIRSGDAAMGHTVEARGHDRRVATTGASHVSTRALRARNPAARRARAAGPRGHCRESLARGRAGGECLALSAGRQRHRARAAGNRRVPGARGRRAMSGARTRARRRCALPCRDQVRGAARQRSPDATRCTAPAELSARDPWSCAIRRRKAYSGTRPGDRVDRRTFVRLLAAVPPRDAARHTERHTRRPARARGQSVSPFRDPRHAGPLPRARRRRGLGPGARRCDPRIGRRRRPRDDGPRHVRTHGDRAPGDAWRHFFEPADVVGIKVNCGGHPYVVSDHAIVAETVRQLINAGVPAAQIYVYERFQQQLDAVNYAPHLPGEVQIVAAERENAYSDNSGYDPATYVEADLFGEEDTRSNMMRLITGRLTKIINIPNVKDHGATGATGCLKNIAYGSFSNVARTHYGSRSHTYSFVGRLASVEPLRSRTVLQIMDGLRGVWHGGPFAHTDRFVFYPRRIFFGTDPVAIDRLLLDIIDHKRKAEGRDFDLGSLPCVTAAR